MDFMGLWPSKPMDFFHAIWEGSVYHPQIVAWWRRDGPKRNWDPVGAMSHESYIWVSGFIDIGT